ncbi:hypothetical protein [Nocardia sp. NPDC052566]|uniref:hypothetical protein n=1 Tax=Nocardia sp. NPDC052566 TaxID=3364330 RepID=UPI0037C57514
MGEHLFVTHPFTRPVLLHRGRICGQARIVVQQLPGPLDWHAGRCTKARINGAEVAPPDLGTCLFAERGIVAVELEFEGSVQCYEFDISIADENDLRGVDGALAWLIEGGDITSRSIHEFFTRTSEFSTAVHYASGIAEYLYWFAGRQSCVDTTTAIKNRDKLNRAADLLNDLNRPVALAIASLISFHFNHFEDAARRTSRQRLGNLSTRLADLLAARTPPCPMPAVQGGLSKLEQALMDDQTAALVIFLSLPMTPETTAEVAAFRYGVTDSYDRFKVELFTAEHHLATGDPRAPRILNDASQYGLPEQWVDARVDLVTD